MRVGVEKAVVEHLGGVVVHELLADLGAVVAGGGELDGVVDGDALDVVHHHDVARAERRVRLRAVEELAADVVAAELLEVARLDEEVGLLAEREPQLVDDALEIEELVRADEAAQSARERAHDGDVLGHDLLDMRALYLDGHELACNQARLVHLGDGGGAERVVVDGVEDLLDGAVVLGAQGGEHRLAVHRLDVGAQLGELAREARRQDLGTHREDLAGLDEGGAELLEHPPQALGRETVEDVVATHDLQDLSDAPKAARAREVVLRRPLGSAAEDADRVRPRIGAVAGHLVVPAVQDLVVLMETGGLVGARLRCGFLFGFCGHARALLGGVRLDGVLRGVRDVLGDGLVGGLGAIGLDSGAHVRYLLRVRGALLGRHGLELGAQRGVGSSRDRGLEGLLDLARELGVQVLALLDGDLALLHELVDELLALLGTGGDGADAGEKRLVDGLAHIESVHERLPSSVGAGLLPAHTLTLPHRGRALTGASAGGGIPYPKRMRRRSSMVSAIAAQPADSSSERGAVAP